MDIDMEKLIEESVFTAARSSGSGGQNVNKVASKVLLSFDVNASAVLDDEKKRKSDKKRLRSRDFDY